MLPAVQAAAQTPARIALSFPGADFGEHERLAGAVGDPRKFTDLVGERPGWVRMHTTWIGLTYAA